MRKRKNGSKKSNAAKGLELCIKVVAVIIEDYTEIARVLGYDRKEIRAYAEAAARLGQIARSGKHLAELLYALDCELEDQRVPLDERGTGLLKRVSRGRLPDVD
jgi:hypothetical protein